MLSLSINDKFLPAFSQHCNVWLHLELTGKQQVSTPFKIRFGYSVTPYLERKFVPPGYSFVVE